MKLSHIRDVLAVAAQGSLRKAGRQIGVSQPAITRSIQEIEHELGAPLFHRHARGVDLTEIGEIFVRRAAVVENELRRAREEIDQARGSSAGQVTVAMSIASSIALMPAVLSTFRRRFPDALLRISETLFGPIEQDLADGRIDVYVGAFEPVDVSPRFSWEKLFDNQRVVVARRGHPLTKGGAHIGALGQASWLRPALIDLTDFEGWLNQIGVPRPRVVVHTGTALQTVLAIASSDLLTVLPRQWLESPAFGGGIEPLDWIEPMAAVPVCLVRQNSAPLTPMAEHLCDVVRHAAANYQRQALTPLG